MSRSASYLRAKALWLNLPTPVAILPMAFAALPLVLEASPAYLGQRFSLLLGLLLVAAAVAAVALRSWALGLLLALWVVVALGVVLLSLSQQATANVGHRCGGHGLGSKAMGAQDNSLEALKELAHLDANAPGGLKDFFYVEFDVRETADGGLVCLHDPRLQDSFPGDVNRAVMQEMGLSSNVDIDKVTLAQIKRLRLGGRAGCTVPTLDEMLAACLSLGIRRTVAVEVKGLATDAGREAFIAAIKAYADKAQASPLEPAADNFNGDARFDCRGYYRPFGARAACAIGFPSAVAHSFGALGGTTSRAWGTRFAAADIPLHSVILHRVQLAPGGRGGVMGLRHLLQDLLYGGRASLKHV